MSLCELRHHTLEKSPPGRLTHARFDPYTSCYRLLHTEAKIAHTGIALLISRYCGMPGLSY